MYSNNTFQNYTFLDCMNNNGNVYDSIIEIDISGMAID